MLEKLLAIITREGSYHPAELARRLEVSETLIEQMLAALQKAGYLQPVETCASDHCGGCQLQSACSTPKARLWVARKI